MIAVIDVFTVEPANQSRLLDILSAATKGTVDRAKGFLGATLHRSLDGTRVTMRAEWASLDDYEAMRRDPAPLRYFEEALSIAKFDPGLYEVVRRFEPRQDGAR